MLDELPHVTEWETGRETMLCAEAPEPLTSASSPVLPAAPGPNSTETSSRVQMEARFQN